MREILCQAPGWLNSQEVPGVTCLNRDGGHPVIWLEALAGEAGQFAGLTYNIAQSGLFDSQH